MAVRLPGKRLLAEAEVEDGGATRGESPASLGGGRDWEGAVRLVRQGVLVPLRDDPVTSHRIDSRSKVKFGHGNWGQLGHGGEASKHTPQLVAGLQGVLSSSTPWGVQGVRVSAVAAGWDHSLLLGEAGEVYSFGKG